MKIQTTPLFSRSLFVLGLGCTLAALPLSVVSAQDTTEKAPTAETTPMPSTAGSANTGMTSSGTNTVTEPKHTKEKVALKDKQFMRKAAGGNEAEVQMAQLALKNAESAEVKTFAQQMIDDHGKANKDLEQIAQDKGLLNFRPELSSESKAMFGKMADMKGTAFDTAYIKHVVADHTEDVREYKAAEKSVQDPELKSYVEKTLPVIEGHLKMSKELSGTKTKAVNS